jgi:hypothetical protein
MTVYFLNGSDIETATVLYTVNTTSSTPYYFPTYESIFIQAVPTAGANNTVLAFNTYLDQLVHSVTDPYANIKIIISAVITFGGLVVVIIGFGIFILYKKVNSYKQTQRFKMSVKIIGAKYDQTKLEEEISREASREDIDFDDDNDNGGQDGEK